MKKNLQTYRSHIECLLEWGEKLTDFQTWSPSQFYTWNGTDPCDVTVAAVVVGHTWGATKRHPHHLDHLDHPRDVSGNLPPPDDLYFITVNSCCHCNYTGHHGPHPSGPDHSLVMKQSNIFFLGCNFVLIKSNTLFKIKLLLSFSSKCFNQSNNKG